MENKSNAADWAQLMDQIDDLARYVGALDPRDPQRVELVNEIYRLTQLAKSFSKIERPHDAIPSVVPSSLWH